MLEIGINLKAFFFGSRFLGLDLKLQFFEYYSDKDNYSKKSFRIVVVDESKAKSYPQNFVCILPVNFAVIANSSFFQFFKDKSLEQAKTLLQTALENEDDNEVKSEIERRLKLLEPKKANQIKCTECGKLYQPRKIRKFKKNFCQECKTKKFGTQT